MKSFQIFLSLIIFINLASFTLEQNVRTVKESEVFQINMKPGEYQILNFKEDTEGVHYLLLLSLNNETNVDIQDRDKLNGQINITGDNPVEINFTKNANEAANTIINFTVAEDTIVEVTSFLFNNDTSETYGYEKFDYLIDTEIPVEKNNFVIFLDKNEFK